MTCVQRELIIQTARLILDHPLGNVRDPGADSDKARDVHNLHNRVLSTLADLHSAHEKDCASCSANTTREALRRANLNHAHGVCDEKVCDECNGEQLASGDTGDSQ